MDQLLVTKKGTYPPSIGVMMKATKKRIYISILSLLAVFGFVSCGTEQEAKQSLVTVTAPETTLPPTTTAPTTTPTTVPAPTTTMPDFSGVDFVALARDIHGKCGEWHDLAISVGWAEEEWDFLSQVIWRESRCQVDAWNGSDAGLTQINSVHRKWLSDMGWSHPNDMFDPEKNLTFALRLWETSGWSPWRFSGPTP